MPYGVEGVNSPARARLPGARFRRDGGSVKAQLDQRDTAFGDYRTKKE